MLFFTKLVFFDGDGVWDVLDWFGLIFLEDHWGRGRWRSGPERKENRL